MATELEAPAAADGQRWLAAHGWSAGKHGGQPLMAIKATVYKASSRSPTWTATSTPTTR